VRPTVRPAAIVRHGRGQVAGLVLVVDLLDVEDGAACEREVDPDAAELGREQGQVEAADVEAGQVGVGQQPRQPRGDDLEPPLLGDEIVGDPVDRRGGRGDRDAGVDQAAVADRLGVGGELEDGDLDDPVVADVDAGGLEVEDGQGPVERQGGGTRKAWGISPRVGEAMISATG
jgi:hypothetical protein